MTLHSAERHALQAIRTQEPCPAMGVRGERPGHTPQSDQAARRVWGTHCQPHEGWGPGDAGQVLGSALLPNGRPILGPTEWSESDTEKQVKSPRGHVNLTRTDITSSGVCNRFGVNSTSGLVNSDLPLQALTEPGQARREAHARLLWEPLAYLTQGQGAHRSLLSWGECGQCPAAGQLQETRECSLLCHDTQGVGGRRQAAFCPGCRGQVHTDLSVGFLICKVGEMKQPTHRTAAGIRRSHGRATEET